MVAVTNLQSPTRLAGMVIAVDPGVTYDINAGFVPGDIVYNTVTNAAWQCATNVAGAALWYPINKSGTGFLLARLIGANMNVTTDQAFTMLVPSTLAYRVTKVSSTNALTVTSLTTVHGGVYTAISKGGTAIVADSATNFSAQSTTAAIIDLTVVTAQLALTQAAGTALWLSLTAAQGAACTSDLRVYGDLMV